MSEQLDLKQFEGHTEGNWVMHRGSSDWGMPRANLIISRHADYEEAIAIIETVTPYCVGASRKDRLRSDTADANGRLIAAAPKLLEEVKELRARVEDLVIDLNCAYQQHKGE